MNRDELIWASGLFEGEGSFSLSKATRGFAYPAAALNMTDEDSVRRFHEALGVGHVYGPYDKGPHKPSWLWKAGIFEEVQFVVAALWSGLGSRRRSRASEVLAAATLPYIQTHCKHGHEFTEENTRITTEGWRVCRACGRESTRRYIERMAMAT